MATNTGAPRSSSQVIKVPNSRRAAPLSRALPRPLKAFSRSSIHNTQGLTASAVASALPQPFLGFVEQRTIHLAQIEMQQGHLPVSRKSLRGEALLAARYTLSTTPVRRAQAEAPACGIEGLAALGKPVLERLQPADIGGTRAGAAILQYSFLAHGLFLFSQHLVGCRLLLCRGDCIHQVFHLIHIGRRAEE